MTRRALAAVCASVLTLCTFAVSSAAVPAELEREVREAALATYIHGMTEEIAHEQVGLDGVPALLALLDDPEFPRRDNVVAFLTYLGGPAETDALLSWLDAGATRIERPSDDRALLLAPQALGHIASRGDGVALDALLSMTGPSSGGGVLARAARAGSDPGALRDDLLEMALRGLAFSGAPSARDRLLDVSRGRVVPADGRPLAGAARRSLALYDELHGAAAAPSTDGDGSVEASGTGSLDVQVYVDDTALSYANHPDVSSPMTDARLDDVLELASLRMGRGDNTSDIACCATLTRAGSAQVFGASGDGLDVIDDNTELNSVLNNSAARFKIVRAINYCGGAGTNIIGCAWRPGNGAAVVRRTNLGSEAVLWAHEYGHNAGLGHNQASTTYIMYSTDYGTNDSLTQGECDKFHLPSSSSGASPAQIGSCTDNDADVVQDMVDNCPGVANADQADADDDGVGDMCESGGDPFCGNGVSESGEQCDGADLAGQTCQSAGFDGGTLSCTSSCTLDTSACTTCGDGVIDAGEECDGLDLGGQTCVSRGYDGGTLSCSASCTYDESSCSCIDLDGDGVTGCDGDCDDSDPARYPGAQEICNDGIDQDCNGRDKTKGCGGGGKGGGGKKGGGDGENCKNGVDDDGDGLVDCNDSDCSGKKFCR